MSNDQFSTPDSSAPALALKDDSGASKRKIVAWAMWDWGTQPFHTVITTFVFAVYLTSAYFGDTNFTSYWLSVSTAIAGLFIAALAPVLGQNADRNGTPVRTLKWLTWTLAAISAGLFFVKPEPSYLWLGLVGLGVGSIIAEIAGVNYNALLEDVAGSKNVGRLSGFGWGLGYLGGIVVMLLLLFLLIQPEVGLFGVTDENALDVRTSMVICGLWTFIFTIPTFIALKDKPKTELPPRIGIVGSYRELWATIVRLWNRSRDTVFFLLASALFRDGLAGVFAFGAVLAAGSFGFDFTETVIFGAVANIVAGVATIAMGTLDDLIGPRRMILISLFSMVVVGILIFVLHPYGKPVFWSLGLVLTIFVGPAQSASRSFLARIIPEGKSGEIFGLYATTGRVVSFFSPAAFGAAIWLGHVITGSNQTQHWGILGITAVLLAGAIVALFVPNPEQIRAAASSSLAGE